MSEEARIQRKRNRKIWSCLECRRKKLQCDHASPACGRCVKAGKAAQCVYVNSNSSTTSPDAINGTSNALRSGNTTFRDDVDTLSGRPAKRVALTRATYDNDMSTIEADGSTMQGACFRTRFTGNTITSSLNEIIPGFNTLTTQAFATYPIMDQVSQFLTKREGRVNLNIPMPPLTTDLELRNLLPPRMEADRLVQVYFDTFDLIYPVLYAPQFDQDYVEMWDSLPKEDARHTILVLLVIAIAYCLESTPFVSRINGEEVFRDKATRIIDCSDCWLHMRVQRQSRALDFQLVFLLYLAKQVNGKRAKRTYINSGAMVRSFMIAGLHRDPERLPRETTQIDQVMRRRLWAAVVDFELQASFEHGMPATAWNIQSDSPPPPNLIDIEVDKAQKSHPITTFTKSSYLAISFNTIEMRHELNTELNDLRQAMSTERVAEYTEELKRAIQKLPTWSDNASAYPHALLLINYHQYIVALHTQQLQRSTSASTQELSRYLMLNSALQILHQHHIASQHQYPVVDIFYNTHARAALGICFAYTTSNPASDQLIISSVEREGLPAIDRAITLVGEKCIRFGMSSEHIWLINAAKALIQTQADPARKEEFVRLAVDRFKEPFERLMAITTDADSSKPQITTDPTLGQDIIAKGYEDLAEWAFDDWTFDPVEFLYPLDRM